jgi:CheY-like chemotaxis protein
MDDAPAILDLLRELLEEDGYRVSAFTSVLPTDRVAALAPDAVVTEWHFASRPAGAEFVAGARRDRRLAEVPLIFLTAAAADAKWRLAGDLAAGRVRVVPKPFDIDRLLAEVERAVGGARGTAR